MGVDQLVIPSVSNNNRLKKGSSPAFQVEEV